MFYVKWREQHLTEIFTGIYTQPAFSHLHMWSCVLSRLLLSAHLCSCPWLVWKSLKLHSSDLHPTSVTVCPCHMPQYQLSGPSAVPVSHSKLSRKVGSWPASGMASFELVLFKVSWPEAIGWHEDSEKGCARDRKTGWLQKLEQNPSFVTCLSGPPQLRGMWTAEATVSSPSLQSVRVWCWSWPYTNASCFILSLALRSFNPAK